MPKHKTYLSVKCPQSVLKKIIIKKNWHAKWHVQHVDIHVAPCQYPYMSNKDTTTILRCSCFLVYPFYLASPLWALMMFCCVSCVALALGMVIITLLDHYLVGILWRESYLFHQLCLWVSSFFGCHSLFIRDTVPWFVALQLSLYLVFFFFVSLYLRSLTIGAISSSVNSEFRWRQWNIWNKINPTMNLYRSRRGARERFLAKGVCQG